MAKRLIIAIGVGVLCGVVAGLVWGRGAGAGIGAFLAILGAIVVVLRRNQKDLRELEQGRVPDEVNRALGGEHRPSPEGPAADSAWP